MAQSTARPSTVKPSTIRIVQSDYLAALAILVPFVLLVLYIAIAYFSFLPGFRGRDPIQGTQGAPFFFYGTICALVVGVPVLLWRIKTIRDMFARGVEVPGQVTRLSFSRDRGKVEFAYTYQGQAYTGRNAIMKTGRTKALTPGSEVLLIVDPAKPTHALVRGLYV
jgi:hypothetical protein